MGQRGGSARSELYTALRFFGHIDAEKRPTPALIAATDDLTVETLRTMIETRYAPVIALGLETATPRQVDDVLVEMGATPSTIGRARTFFLNAAEEAGIEVGRPLKTARAPAAKRRSPRKPKVTEDAPPVDLAAAARSLTSLPPLIGALVEKLPSEADGWTEADARQWLALAAPAVAYDYKLDLSKLAQGGSGPMSS